MITWIFIGAISIPIVILAIFLLSGRGASLISGYNMISADKRATYDEKALCRSVGTLLLVIVAILLLFPLAIYLQATWLLFLATILSIVIPIGYAIYANTGNRFRNPAAPNATPGAANIFVGFKSLSRGKKLAVFIAIILSVQLCIGIGLMFYRGEMNPVVRFHSDRIQISAMYGLDVDFTNIADVSLINSSMSQLGTGSRTDGYGGRALKGHFSSSESGSRLLFVDPSSSPTIRIERVRGADIYISYSDSAKTIATYNELISAIP